MPEATYTETCDCPRDHFRTTDGRCNNPPLWHDDPELLDKHKYTACGCCMADCPDVHAEPDPNFAPVPGSTMIAAEYVATLSDEAQQDLRAQEARGELRITPRAQMLPTHPDQIVILPSVLRHDGSGDGHEHPG